MKPRVHLSERQQVGLILVLAVAAVFGIWFGLLRPQYRKRADIAALQAQLDASTYAGLSMESLRLAAEHESGGEKTLNDEWERTIRRLATSLETDERRNAEGRIDYKVQLFDIRVRLIAKSTTIGIQLIPVDLGLDDALGGTEAEVRTRILQLKAVERLADLALDRRIQRLRAIQPLAPAERRGPDGKRLVTEYPVRVDFDIGFDNLFMLFQAAFAEGQVFVFRNLRIESGAQPKDPLRVKAVMSALLFD